MSNELKFYIDGAWVDPVEPRTLDVINPATEEPVARISLGSAADVDRAVKAARAAFPAYSHTPKAERLALLQRIVEAYKARYDDIARAISLEMGAPASLATKAQAATGVGHLNQMIAVLTEYEFEQKQGRTLIVREPIGVCGFITPWNWPINQIMCKVAPALAAGCTMVLKPSEIAPLNAIIFAEVLHAAGVPRGVFNLVNGDGPTVGQAIASHPGVDLVSFTGSTRAGILVAKAAADTVKRVHQELGGKSANIILPDADLKKAVADGVRNCFRNSGQSCNAPTRMFVHAEQHDDAVAVAREAAESVVVGPPDGKDTVIGPVVSEAQFNKIQRLIEAGIKEGATLVTGGPGRPEGLLRGYYVRPTVFANVKPEMTISREEIFGPVLSILPYETEEKAVEMANDTVYGLAGYVQSGDLAHARRVAAELRAGQIALNGAPGDVAAPFGGYKQSGNGREWGKFGFEEFLEIKAVMGA
ncbi:MAG TPA: aldehyde dehydrogenase family protein [Candidatus Methylomirabilis sp.]|nr:aldehyde dehydrogenase family protein [Candidatus Methylomirabilis sp.]